MARMKIVARPNVQQEIIALTKEENDARDAEELAWVNDKIKRDAMEEIRKLEAQETPRRLAESVLSDDGKAWLTANREKIVIERAKL